MKNYKYADRTVVKWGFYKNCEVRIKRRRLFGLWYYCQIISPYFGDYARIWGFLLRKKM